MGWMLGVVEYRLHSRFQHSFLTNRATGVSVAIETGEIAARDLHSNLMPRFEHVAGGPQIYVVFVDLVRLQQHGRRGGVAIASANDTVGQVPCATVLANID